MFIALDLETTGLDLVTDEIIEIALVKVDSKTFEIIDSFSSFINPWIPIPALISNITSINEDDVLMSPFIDEIEYKIKDFIGDLPILWHNIWFDIWFLSKAWIDLSKNISLDTFNIANFLSFNEKSLSLESLCISYNIKLEWAHRALNDTIATVRLFEKLMLLISKLTKTKKEILKYIFSRTGDSWFAYIIDNYFDSSVVLIDSSIFIKYILKKFPEHKKGQSLIVDKDLNIDSSKILLSTMKSIELRENQEKMLDIIDTSLKENKLNLIEAPTGLWKTFAYLTPSIIYSVKNWEQIFVSTTTKALQDQIFYKDLAFLKENLDFDFSYSKLKGKRNYLSIHNLIKFISEIDYFTKLEASFILKIIFWVYETKSFELDELDYYWDEFSFTKEINADDSMVFSKKNIYEKREPAVIARKLARTSNIVIVNNSILFQDIAWDNTILWNIKNLVLDEAHNLEDVVTNALKKSFSIKDLEKTFNNILVSFKKFKHKINDFSKDSDDVLFNLQLIFDSLEIYLDYKVKDNTNYKNALIEQDFYNNNIDNFNIDNLWKTIKISFNSLIDNLKITPDDLYLEINREISYLEMIVDIVDKILDKGAHDKYIRTINFSNYKWLFIEYTLLNVWEFLDKSLWSKLDSCILTSATLSIENNFEYITKMLNLSKFDFFKLDSDFNYSKQALLYIPNDLWNIKNNLDLVTSFLREFILVVKGKTLVLFTSLYLIKNVFSSLWLELKKEGINIYAQWVWWGKNKLLDFYKKNSSNSVLLWTDTFWEWIDLVWDELKYLIIHKVPFMVPSDPIFQARSKLFSDSFNWYSVPKAIIKLKQWFWRLIRSKDDSGIIIFLDNRVYATSWGEWLLKAFPSDINIKKWSYKWLLKVLSNSKKQEVKK